MITRTWHGRTKIEEADNYLEQLINAGTEDYRNTPGNISIKVWKQMDNDFCHFHTVTEWESMDAVKAFAGEDFEKAVYYPEDEGILLEFEEKVKHHETYDVSNTQLKHYILQLNQLHKGGAWLGPGFDEKMRGIDEPTAFMTPIPGLHSIAEIVWHCLYWKKVAIKHFEGDHKYREQTMSTLNFISIEELRTKGWITLLQEWDRVNEALVNVLANQKDSILSEYYRLELTYRYLIEGIIQHDAYHLGQIGLILKIQHLMNGIKD